MVPVWLVPLADVSLILGALSAAVIAIDELRTPQKMRIMNVVWPVAALFGTLAVVWAYWRYGRPSAGPSPFPVQVAKGALHCGAGCCLGDLCAEWFCVGFPGIAVWFGWGWLFGERTYAIWVIDFLAAFSLGVVFQYFAIAPMRHLGLREGLWQAVKADALSLTAWQVGMYGFMAFAKFYLFQRLLGAPLEVTSPNFWFLMQIAMLCGFATAYPANWWLIRAGVKEAM